MQKGGKKGDLMSRNYTKKFKEENAFFINPATGRVEFNKLCNQCMHECKQSYRAEIVACKNYKKKSEEIL